MGETRDGESGRALPHMRGSPGLNPHPSPDCTPNTAVGTGPLAEPTAITRLGSAHQDLSLLLILPLLLDLIQLLEKPELGPDVTCLLISVIILQRR